MQIKNSKTLFVLVISCFLSGCIPYPVYKTTQPEASALVLNAKNKPEPDVEVSLISSSYPYGWEKARMLVLTDRNGVAEYNRLAEWRIEAIMLHGAELFFWNWCVYKRGFVTQITHYSLKSDFDAEPVFILAEGNSHPCPEPFNDYMDIDAEKYFIYR